VELDCGYVYQVRLKTAGQNFHFDPGNRTIVKTKMITGIGKLKLNV
jgi:hypothetical protein